MKVLRKLLLPVGLLVVFGMGYFLALEQPQKDSVISVEVAPEDSVVTIDGRDAQPGENKLTAGPHNVKVTKDGFAPQSKSITTRSADNIYAGFILQSNEEETSNWYADNPSDQKLAEGIGSHSSDYDSDQAITSNSLLQLLPFSYGDGRRGLVEISYGVPLEGSSQPAIYIKAGTPEDRQGALKWIRSNGYEPAEMDIVFYNELSVYAEPEGE